MMSRALNNPKAPQTKVLVAGKATALLAFLNDLLAENGLDWETVLRMLVGWAITIAIGYFAPEKNPSASSIETMRQRGLLEPEAEES